MTIVDSELKALQGVDNYHEKPLFNIESVGHRSTLTALVVIPLHESWNPAKKRLGPETGIQISLMMNESGVVMCLSWRE